MFFTSEQGGHDNASRLPAQHVNDSLEFVQNWPSHLSQMELGDEGAGNDAPLYAADATEGPGVPAGNIQFDDHSLVRPQHLSENSSPFLAQAATFEEVGGARRSSAPAAPHLDYSRLTPSNQSSESLPSPCASPLC
jgi:hypothetical protein